jgi:hypothetical protein
MKRYVKCSSSDSEIITKGELKEFARSMLPDDNPLNISILKMFEEIIDKAPTSKDKKD